MGTRHHRRTNGNFSFLTKIKPTFVSYIQIDRAIMSHWIWQNPIKLKWFLTMMMEANFTDGKILLGNATFLVKRGQSANSIRTWALKFETGTKSVTSFFDLLEKENMISRKTIGKGKQSTTLINIDVYDEFTSIKETQVLTQEEPKKPRKGNTIKEYNKLKILDIEMSIVPEELQPFLTIAKSFQSVFIKNLKDKNAPFKTQENATFENYVTPIRLMIETDGVTVQDLRDVKSYLMKPESEFWKKNILSTSKLRQQITKLLMAARPDTKNEKNNTSQSTKVAFKFSIDETDVGST